jgi:hypothetical protein
LYSNNTYYENCWLAAGVNVVNTPTTSDTTHLIYSLDNGKTWDKFSNFPNYSSSYPMKLARGIMSIFNNTKHTQININPKFFISNTVSSNYNLYTSTNIGSTLNQISINNILNSKNCIKTNGEIYICLSSDINNTLLYSYDSKKWINLGNSIFSIAGYDCCWNGEYWLASGEGSFAIAKSFNGIMWTPIATSFYRCRRIYWDGLYWIAVGSSTISGGSMISYSLDGVLWTNVSVANFTGLETFYDITLFKDKLFIGGGNIDTSSSTTNTNTILYNTNLTNNTWNISTGSSLLNNTCIKFESNGKYLIAVGKGTSSAIYTIDGINWFSLGNYLDLCNSISYINNSWMIYGNKSNIGKIISTNIPTNNTNLWTEILSSGTDCNLVGYTKNHDNISNNSHNIIIDDVVKFNPELIPNDKLNKVISLKPKILYF